MTANLPSIISLIKGYERPLGRGVGTRSYVVILATSSRASSFCRQLSNRVRHALGADVSRKYPNIDGIVSVTHTEGGGDVLPNNADLVIRTLW